MNEFNYWNRNPSKYMEDMLGIKISWYQKMKIDTSTKVLNWFALRNRLRYTKDNKIIVYPNEKFMFSRGSGKTNLEFAIFKASLEATLTNKPVIVNYGMQLVDIDDLK